MAIIPNCDRCGEELSKFGGILLSPPNEKGLVKKFHLCDKCYLLIESEVKKLV